MVHVASSQRSREVEAEDERINVTDCVRLFYPNIIVFIVLDSKSIIVFLVFYSAL
jgi:hypothetical protein